MLKYNGHTPGPWRIERPWRKKRQTDFQKQIEHGQEFIIMTPNGHRVAVVDGPSNIEKADEHLMNAKLIAAAPDLLDAAKWAIGWILQGYGSMGKGWQDAVEEHKAAREKLEAAVAKVYAR
jgi:hypothetical protein